MPTQDEGRRAALRIAATHLAGKRHLTATLPEPKKSLWRTPVAKPAAVMRAYARTQARNLLARLRVDPDAFRARQSARTRQAIKQANQRLADGEPARAAATLLQSLRRPRLFPHEHDDHRLLVKATRDIHDRLPESAKALRRHLRWQEQTLSHRLPDSTLEHAAQLETKARDQARAQGGKPRPTRETPSARTMVQAYYRQQAARLLHVLRVHPERLRARSFARTHRFAAQLNTELVGKPVSYARMNTDAITPDAATRAAKRFVRTVNRPRLMPYSPPERYLLLGVAATLQEHLPDSERRLTARLTHTAAVLSAEQRIAQTSRPRPMPARPGPRWSQDIDLTR